MIDQESKFNPEVVSKTGDYGLMQINTINHEWLAEEYRTADMLDPYQNVFCGIKVIGSYIQNYNDCNDLPMVTDKSLFASERIKVVEFNRHFSPEEQDTHLKDELCEQSSMSGIFMWLVRGYIHYKERGLAMSGSLKSVVTKYERDNDLVLQFLENRCERVPEESSPTVIKAKDLYNAFKIWAKSEGAYILSARKFNSEMERHPEWFDRKSTSSGYATYCGLKLKEVL